MKSSLVYAAFLIMILGCSTESSKENFWNKQKAEQWILNREDSSKWDSEMFTNDMEFGESGKDFPFNSSVFPTPAYDLVGTGSFKGLGNFGYPGGEGSEIKLNDKTILYNSFFIKASDVNSDYLTGRKDEIFFQIIMLTDFIDTLNYSHTSSEIVSRNHPHYMGQGFYKTKENKIDYMAFITADRHSYAVVNMRLFDLSLGKTILIAPQKDKSFRSMQIQSPVLSSDDVEHYTEELFKEKSVSDFFLAEGNI